MKKAVFFDGDGTLWYPKTTLRIERPHWVYTDPLLESSSIPNTATTLRTLGTLGISGTAVVK